MKWSTSNNNLFFQLSEDWKLKLYDVRISFKLIHNQILGNDIPTSFDIDDSGNLITTGHWGSQYLNSKVELWDIRKLGDNEFQSLSTYEHK